MRIYDILAKKRDGGKLTRGEIDYFIRGYVAGDIPDYQASALLMAAFIRGLDDEETAALTDAMAHSGDMADLSALGTVADKHSTGGVADTTTLLVVPLVCACGLRVAKMSGRGLGHTGGTLDKLASIPGMTTALDMDAFTAQIGRVGAAVMGQTLRLCPADKLLYALRDVTATVESIPLIASSIMSKKLASGAGLIMLDVKTGNGAFMADPGDARALAQAMVRIGNMSGRKTAAIISDMSQPLGNAVGNSLEVIEAIELLQGKYEGDLLTVAMALSARMLCLAGIAKNMDGANSMLAEALHSGRALRKLGEIIGAQGGDARVTEDTSLMPRAHLFSTAAAQRGGVISAFDCRGLGLAAGALGAGRMTKDDAIDLTVGFILKKRIGGAVQPGETLFEVHANDAGKMAQAMSALPRCVTISESAVKPALIYDTVG
jgi:pyrimidine-nucleoside phosphorylase